MVSVVAKKLKDQRNERGKKIDFNSRPFGYQYIIEIRITSLVNLKFNSSYFCSVGILLILLLYIRGWSALILHHGPREKKANSEGYVAWF